MDLWSLFDFLMPGFLGTERQVSVLFFVNDLCVDFLLPLEIKLIFTSLDEHLMNKSKTTAKKGDLCTENQSSIMLYITDQRLKNV